MLVSLYDGLDIVLYIEDCFSYLYLRVSIFGETTFLRYDQSNIRHYNERKSWYEFRISKYKYRLLDIT